MGYRPNTPAMGAAMVVSTWALAMAGGGMVAVVAFAMWAIVRGVP